MAAINRENCTVSQFTYKDIQLLKKSSHHSPLRVVAWIEIDCFYAQCESIRRNLAPDQPLGVLSQDNVIELNYAARRAGLQKAFDKWKTGRRRNIKSWEAEESCNRIILQHIPVIRDNIAEHPEEGYDFWENSTDKLSHKYYKDRLQEVLHIVQHELFDNTLEISGNKSAIVIDLSPKIHDELVQTYGLSYSGLQILDDYPPMPTEYNLDWTGSILVPADKSNTTSRFDWDTVVMNVGAKIVHLLRQKIQEQQHYTTSAGIACSDILARLAAQHDKLYSPETQTVVPARATTSFLVGFKFTQLKDFSFDSKRGKEYVDIFKSDSISDISTMTLDDLRAKIVGAEAQREGDQLRKLQQERWIIPKFYDAIHGFDTHKHRGSDRKLVQCETFSPHIAGTDTVKAWLENAVRQIYRDICAHFGDFYSGNGTVLRPKKLEFKACIGRNSHLGRTQTKTLGADIPRDQHITEQTILSLAQKLLERVVAENSGTFGPFWRLSVGVSNFDQVYFLTETHQTRLTASYNVGKVRGAGVPQCLKETQEPTTDKDDFEALRPPSARAAFTSRANASSSFDRCGSQSRKRNRASSDYQSSVTSRSDPNIPHEVHSNTNSATTSFTQSNPTPKAQQRKSNNLGKGSSSNDPICLDDEPQPKRECLSSENSDISSSSIALVPSSPPIPLPLTQPIVEVDRDHSPDLPPPNQNVTEEDRKSPGAFSPDTMDTLNQIESELSAFPSSSESKVYATDGNDSDCLCGTPSPDTLDNLLKIERQLDAKQRL